MSASVPRIILHNKNRIVPDVGDSNATLTWGVDDPNQKWATTLTTTRTADLLSTGAFEGAEFHLFRLAGAPNLAVTRDGGPVQKNMGANTWSTWIFAPGGWELKAFGSL